EALERGSELAAGLGRGVRVLLGPAGDRARAGDHLAVVKHEDRHLVGAAQLLHLGPVIAAPAPRPGHQPVAADDLQLVLIARLVERLAGFPAGMGESRPVRLLPTGVEDHWRKLSCPLGAPSPTSKATLVLRL